MSPPKVSIVVPVCNGEQYLRELLDSIKGQSFADWRCVCVDDGSTDKSADIIKSYCAADSRFVLFAQANAGVGAARNTALRHVGTPYVMFADQDDLMHRQAVEIAVESIEKSQTDMVQFAYDHFCGSWAKKSYPSGSVAVKKGGSPCDDINVDTTIAIWSHIFRTDSIRRVEFPHLTGGEDTVFMFELKWRHATWARVMATLYGNRLRSGSFSRGLSDRYVRNVFEGFHEIGRRAKTYSISHQIVQRIVRKHAKDFALSIILTQGVQAGAFKKYDVLNEEFDRLAKEGLVDNERALGFVVVLLRKRRYGILKSIAYLSVPMVKIIQWIRR